MNSRYRGITRVLVAATLWGVSGTVAQMLFHQQGFTPGWLVTMRLLVSGVLLLTIGCFRRGSHQLLAVWQAPRDRIQLAIFGLVGMLGVQYTYFAAIQTGNAATATLLQYLAPLFITAYLAIRHWRLPDFPEFLALELALLGTFLLVTNGSIHDLSVPGIAVVWGVASAIALAFYTIYPSALLQRWDSDAIVGWGMAIGGIGFSPIVPPWRIQGQNWSAIAGLGVGFVILFGTLIAFYLYLDSLRYITPTEACLLASAEPLSAAIASVIWLQVPLGLYQGIGGFCIITTVMLLSLHSQRKNRAS